MGDNFNIEVDSCPEVKERKKLFHFMPKYTLKEEVLNSVTHGAGVLFSIAALVLGVVFSVLYGDVWCVVSVAIYGATLILSYLMSTIYHALRVNMAKWVFRIFDHCCIFLLIAGTYTPFTLVTLRKEGAWGWVLFGVIWGAAAVGIVLNSIDLHKFRVVSMVCYIAMGWAIIFAVKPMLNAFSSKTGLLLLLLGGVFYTVGAVIYGLGKRVKYMHSVWHIFVLAGSILHFFCILFYVVIV